MRLNFIQEKKLGYLGNIEQSKYDAAQQFLDNNPQYTTRLSALSERYANLPLEVLDPLARNTELPVDSPSIVELCDEYNKQWCAQASEVWETSREKHNTGKHIEDMTMHYSDILFGLGSLAYAPFDDEKDIKVGKTQTSLWFVALQDALSEITVKWNPFNVSPSIPEPYMNQETGELISNEQYDALNPMEKMLYAIPGARYLIKDNYPIFNSRVWAYAQQLNAMDRYMEQGYTKEQAQKFIPIDFEKTKVEGLGEKENWLDETKQWLKFAKEADEKGGEAYLFEMLNQVSLGQPVNYNRDNIITVESLIAENQPEFEDLLKIMSYDEAVKYTYARLGIPIVKPNEDGEINWTSIQNPNQIEAFAGRRFIYNPAMAQEYADTHEMNMNEKLNIKIPYSQGRYQASLQHRVGSEAYNSASGWIDGKARIIPELFGGFVVRGLRKANKLLKVVNKYEDDLVFDDLKKQEIATNWAKQNNRNPITGEAVDNVDEVLPTLNLQTTKINKFTDELASELKNAKKQSKKMRKQYGLFGGVAPGVLHGTPKLLTDRLAAGGKLKSYADNKSLYNLDQDYWTKEFPYQIKKELVDTDTEDGIRKIFEYAYGDGYMGKGMQTPFKLHSLPKGQSYMLNEAIRKVTGTNPGLPSLGSIAGRGISKAIQTVDNASRGVFRRNATNIRLATPDVLSDLRVLRKADYRTWLDGGERIGRNLGFYSELTGGMSPYWRKKFATVPGAVIPFSNKQDGYNTVVKHILNSGINPKIADNLLNEFIGMKYTINNVLKFGRKLGGADIDKVAVEANPRRAQIVENHLKKLYDRDEQIQQYLVDPNVGKMIPNQWTVRQVDDAGNTWFVPTITKLSEAAQQGAPLISRRIIDRALGKRFDEVPDFENGRFVENAKMYIEDLQEQGGLLKNIKIPGKSIEKDIFTNVLDKWMSYYQKPRMITKQALTSRVLLEEQLFFAVHPDLKGALDSPFFYFQWLYSYGQLPKRHWLKNVMKKIMDSGEDVNEVTLSHAYHEAIQANFAYSGFNLAKINKRNTQYVPVSMDSPKALEARVFQYEKLFLDPISRRVASFDKWDDVVAWSQSPEAIKLRDRLIDATGSTFTTPPDNSIRKQKNWINYLMERENEIRMNTGMKLTESRHYGENADGTFWHDVSDAFIGSPELRNGIATGKIIDKNGREISLLPKFENAFEKYRPQDRNKVKRYIKSLMEEEIDGEKLYDFGYAILPKNPRANEFAELGDFVDDNMERIFEYLLTSPLARLNRAPIFKQLRWAILSDNVQKFGPKLQKKLIDEAEAANIPKYMINKIKGLAALKSGKIDDYDSWSDIANSYALQTMKSFLYDTKNRHRISDVTRNIFPFPEVFIEMGKRWGKAAFLNPYLGRYIALGNKGFQTLDGQDVYAGQGIFGVDPVTEQEVFLYPWAGAYNNLVYGDGTNFKMVPQGFVSGINMVSTQKWPSTQPMVQYQLDQLMDATEVNQTFQDQFFGDFPPPKDLETAIKGNPIPFLSKFRAATKGSLGGSQLLWEAISDTYVDKDNNFQEWDMNNMYMSMRAESTLNLYEAVKGSYDQQRLLETGQLDKYINHLMDNWDGKKEVIGFDELLNYYQQTGAETYPFAPGELTPEILDRATLQWSAHKAQVSLLIRSLAQYGFPTGFSLRSAITDKSGKWWSVAVLAEEYNNLVEKHNGNQRDASNEFWLIYGIDHAYLTTSTKDKTGYAKVYDRSVVQWKKENKDEITMLPKSYNYLNPSNPQAERTYDEMIHETTRNPNEFMYAQNDTVAWFKKQRYAEITRATYGDNQIADYLIRAYTNALEDAHPGFNDAYGKREKLDPQTIFEEMEALWTTLDFPMNYEAGQGFNKFYEYYWEPAVLESQNLSGSGSTTWWRTSKKGQAVALRSRVSVGAYAVIQDYPEFLSIYQNVILRLFASDTEMLDYNTALEEQRKQESTRNR